MALAQLGDMPEQDVLLTVYDGRLISSPGGGTLLALVASTDPRVWDCGFALVVDWDAQPPLGGPLLAVLSSAPARDRLEIRRGGGAYVARGPALRVAFSAVEPAPDGVLVRATWDGTACRTDAPADCVAVTGSADTVVHDDLRAAGTPDPEPIIL